MRYFFYTNILSLFFLIFCNVSRKFYEFVNKVSAGVLEVSSPPSPLHSQPFFLSLLAHTCPHLPLLAQSLLPSPSSPKQKGPATASPLHVFTLLDKPLVNCRSLGRVARTNEREPCFRNKFLSRAPFVCPLLISQIAETEGFEKTSVFFEVLQNPRNTVFMHPHAFFYIFNNTKF